MYDMFTYTPLSIGGLTATLFFMREDKRIREDTPFDEMFSLIKEHNVSFKDVSFEMFFIAELKHHRYYPIDDFERLCNQCFDFTKFKAPPINFDVPGFDFSRKINRIQSLRPIWIGR